MEQQNFFDMFDAISPMWVAVIVVIVVLLSRKGS